MTVNYVETYWNHKGNYPKAAEALQGLIPTEGEVTNPAHKQLEKLRKAVNYYYDLYNNGLCNYRPEFRRMFDVRVPRDGSLTQELVEGKEVVAHCDALDRGESIDTLYLKPLYN